MLVTRIKQIKEETITLTELEDLEEYVIGTMGEDVWNAIMYFYEEPILELKEKLEILEIENPSIETVEALKQGIRDGIDRLEKVIADINNVNRINKRAITHDLGSIKLKLKGFVEEIV